MLLTVMWGPMRLGMWALLVCKPRPLQVGQFIPSASGSEILKSLDYSLKGLKDIKAAISDDPQALGRYEHRAAGCQTWKQTSKKKEFLLHTCNQLSAAGRNLYQVDCSFRSRTVWSETTSRWFQGSDVRLKQVMLTELHVCLWPPDEMKRRIK